MREDLTAQGVDPTDDAIWPEPVAATADPEISIIYELDDGPALAYQCRGHVERDVFLSALQCQWGKTCPLDKIERVYVLLVPRPQYGVSVMEQLILTARGRGRTPVTQVECRWCEPLKRNWAAECPHPDATHCKECEHAVDCIPF